MVGSRWRPAVVGGWRLVAVDDWWRLAVGGWRLPLGAVLKNIFNYIPELHASKSARRRQRRIRRCWVGGLSTLCVWGGGGVDTPIWLDCPPPPPKKRLN